MNEKIEINNHSYNNNSDNITLNNTENNNTNSINNFENKEKIYDYVHNIIKEPFSLENLKKFNISFNPKISVIISSYNCEKNLKNIQRSIQDQSFGDIEIIYVDDCSTDNSSEIIKSFQEIDHRIVYLKNKVNKGPFYSRNKGALFARGQYIQFVDADDLLVNNILDKTLKIIEEKKVDIVQYAVIRGIESFTLINEKYTQKSLILQPELSDEMFYGRGYLKNQIFIS
jgi:cellulose synthase/poly-beta-1,6-N-acetylglucosamine synthase-like glycosyltransferase